ncbi:hypothetical protein [Chachezhania antarctica]|uniref:hypothetical protein n=1 Tax=Chachezhania antarctica TaxID=2340860 RepID=UPI000EAD476E|nr:hypothetical protein [Chachezhania antarctica]|tara:strand:- start:10509 stop:10724 length:216 start_codon:yes stop_codon:yes gene_type:complete
MPERWELHEMMQKAARGLGKVDELGPRGTTLVSQEEIEAMAGTLALFGLVPIPPGAPVPEIIHGTFEEPQT